MTSKSESDETACRAAFDAALLKEAESPHKIFGTGETWESWRGEDWREAFEAGRKHQEAEIKKGLSAPVDITTQSSRGSQSERSYTNHRTGSDLEAQLKMKRDDWLQVCKDYDKLEAKCQGLVEALEPFASVGGILLSLPPTFMPDKNKPAWDSLPKAHPTCGDFYKAREALAKWGEK